MNDDEFLDILKSVVASGPKAFEEFLKERVTPGLYWRQSDAMIGFWTIKITCCLLKMSGVIVDDSIDGGVQKNCYW